jgi:hypothetical protein
MRDTRWRRATTAATMGPPRTEGRFFCAHRHAPDADDDLRRRALLLSLRLLTSRVELPVRDPLRSSPRRRSGRPAALSAPGFASHPADPPSGSSPPGPHPRRPSMTTLFLALTPAWPTGRSTSEILAGVAWRTSASSGSIVDHRTDPRTGTVSVVIETDPGPPPYGRTGGRRRRPRPGWTRAGARSRTARLRRLTPRTALSARRSRTGSPRR